MSRFWRDIRGIFAFSPQLVGNSSIFSLERALLEEFIIRIALADGAIFSRMNPALLAIYFILIRTRQGAIFDHEAQVES